MLSMVKLELARELSADGVVHLLVRLCADGQAPVERRPVNLALVIDRSSSMRGPRIAQAARAALQLLDQLGPRDRLSLVVFDSSARLLWGPAPVGDRERAQLRDTLATLDTGVGTNLAAGIKKGAEAIRSGFVRDAVARLILLTDGLPSVGLTDPVRLGELVDKENQVGVTTTTMGLGDGFDDELLAELARRGRGGVDYMAEAGANPAGVGRELNGVFAIAAARVELKLIPSTEVASVDVVHRLPSRPLDDGLLVEVGELAAGARRQVLFRIMRNAEVTGTRLGTLAVGYKLPDGSAGDGHVVGIEVPAEPDPAEIRQVARERLRLAATVAVDAVWARRASSDIAQALAHMGEIRRQVADARDRGLVDRREMDQLMADMAAAEEAVAKGPAERERARKSLRERSHITMLGQSQVGRLPTDDD
jgi:Ca-activated chloride channel family protein